jgi:hypothetical protein
MQNYYIRQSETRPESKLVYFEGVLIGEIYPSKHNTGYMVRPVWAKYEGFFLTFEKACVELVSHYWAQHRDFPLEC